MSSYYDFVYGSFQPPKPKEPKTYVEKYKAEWDKAVKRLKDSGYDLSKNHIYPKQSLLALHYMNLRQKSNISML